MSLDLQLAWPCPHLTLEEVVELDTDRRGMVTRQPVAALGAVRVLVNDEFFIPQFGLSVPAQLISHVAGPFDVVPNENVLVVETQEGTETLTLGVTSATRWKASEVVTELLRKGLTIALPEDSNGYLVLSDVSTAGPNSFVKVSGTAAYSLGFGKANQSDRPWAAEGRQLYPAWDLVQKASVSGRYPRFQEPLQGNPVIKVSYTTTVNRCLRCQATFVENDYRFTQSGAAILIQNEDLLYQASLKILLSDLGSNPFHRWYGTRIRSRIGAKAIGGVASLISEDVRKALANLQKLQVQQAEYQLVTSKERLYSILDVQVSPHQQDPTTFKVDVVVQNASGEPVQVNIVFTVPEVVALMGSNGLMLGTESTGVR